MLTGRGSFGMIKEHDRGADDKSIPWLHRDSGWLWGKGDSAETARELSAQRCRAVGEDLTDCRFLKNYGSGALL